MTFVSVEWALTIMNYLYVSSVSHPLPHYMTFVAEWMLKIKSVCLSPPPPLSEHTHENNRQGEEERVIQ